MEGMVSRTRREYRSMNGCGGGTDTTDTSSAGTITCTPHAHRTHVGGHVPSGCLSCTVVHGSGRTSASRPVASVARKPSTSKKRRRRTSPYIARRAVDLPTLRRRVVTAGAVVSGLASPRGLLKSECLKDDSDVLPDGFCHRARGGRLAVGAADFTGEVAGKGLNTLEAAHHRAF